MALRTDYRDQGGPGEKEWNEFRATYAGARLFVWLLSELDEVAPSYVQDLRDRINEAICAGEGLAEDDPTYDGAAILHSPVRRDATFINEDDAYLLEEQLFPSFQAQPLDFQQAVRGLAVIGLHSALEAYCSACGVTIPRMPLPKAIDRFVTSVRRRAPLDSGIADTLTELDETRHIRVHHRGVVSERYAQNVRYNSLQVGEFRTITQGDLDRFAEVVWTAAMKLRPAGSGEPPAV